MKPNRRAKAHRSEFMLLGSKQSPVWGKFQARKGQAREGLTLPMVHAESHIHPSVTAEVLAWVLALFAGRVGFFKATVAVPISLLQTLMPCALHGPETGWAAVPEDEVTYAPRGDRPYASRMVDRPMGATSLVTLIAGPHDGRETVVYTVYAGPEAPQEPGDPGCRDLEASKAFWAQHALSPE